jgi:hypothetical protein
MKFHDYVTWFDCLDANFKRKNSREDFYRPGPGKPEIGEPFGIMLALERGWYAMNRPYFKVWPSIAEALMRVRLDVPAELVSIDCIPVIAIRVAEITKAGTAIHPGLRSVLAGWFGAARDTWVTPCLGISYQYGIPDFRSSQYLLELVPGESAESLFDKLKRRPMVPGSGDPQRFSVAGEALRLVIAVAMLASDPSIISPDVLSRDRDRFDRSTDPVERQRLIDKARRRGIVGWRIGEQYETIPHYRRPHPALYHVGKGRHDQRIVFRAGSIVHRQKLTEIPTGYLTEEGEEIEA